MHTVVVLCMLTWYKRPAISVRLRVIDDLKFEINNEYNSNCVNNLGVCSGRKPHGEPNKLFNLVISYA